MTSRPETAIRSGRKRLSLQVRVFLFTILTATVLLVAIESVTHWRTVTALENEIGGQINAAAKQLVEKIDNQPIEDIAPKFKNLIQAIRKKVPSIIRVDIYAKQGKALNLITSNVTKERVLEDFEREALLSGKAKTYMIEPEPGRRRIVTVRPVRFHDGSTGIVTVICSLKPFRQLLAIHARMRNTSLAITIVLLVITVTWMFQSGIYSNIRHFVAVMNRFRKGEDAARVRVDLPGEFGDLAVQLNMLLDEVSQFQVKLKGDIETATHSLSQRNIELNELNLRMHDMQKKLVHAERLALIGQLTATFAHEIGSPLSAVATHLQMLEEELRDTEMRGRVRTAYEQVNRICMIVEKMLARARQTRDMEPIDLREIVEKVMGLVLPVLQMKQIGVRTQWDVASAPLRGDSELLQQLFLNLFNNAMDALSGQNDGEIILQLDAVDHPQPGFRIRFEDNGSGIPANKLNDIFEPFFTTKQIGKGTGLGLAVCREIVKRHSGTIAVESRPGRTCFVITLPESPAADWPKSKELS